MTILTRRFALHDRYRSEVAEEARQKPTESRHSEGHPALESEPGRLSVGIHGQIVANKIQDQFVNIA